MAAPKKTKPLPAYVAWATFTRFLDEEKEAPVPHNEIDRTVLGKMSGSTQTHLLASLRFLRLTNGQGETQPALRTLVEARDTEEWQSVLSACLDAAYSEIVKLDTVGAYTPGQLIKAFRETGIKEGATLSKALRFFLRAAEDAGVTISTLLKKAPGMANPQAKKKEPPPAEKRTVDNEKERGETGKEDSGKVPPPEGLMSITVTYPGVGEGAIQVPESFTAAHVDYIAAVLRGYVVLQED